MYNLNRSFARVSYLPTTIPCLAAYVGKYFILLCHVARHDKLGNFLNDFDFFIRMFSWRSYDRIVNITL